jgi:hypothetical protein
MINNRALGTWATQRRAGNGSTADFLALVQRVCGRNIENLPRPGSSTRPAHPHHLRE